MSTKIKYGTGLLLALFFLLVLCPSAFAEDGRAWTWLSSNDKYSKFYAPASVHVMQGATAAGTGKTVATAIEAEIKTSFSYEGAEETILCCCAGARVSAEPDSAVSRRDVL